MSPPPCPGLMTSASCFQARSPATRHLQTPACLAVWAGNGQGHQQQCLRRPGCRQPLGDMTTSSRHRLHREAALSVGANYYGDTIKKRPTSNINIFSSTGGFGIGAPLMTGTGKFAATEKLNINTVGFDTAFKWRVSMPRGSISSPGRRPGFNNTLAPRDSYAQVVISFS